MESTEDAWVKNKEDIYSYYERDINHEDERDGFCHFSVSVLSDLRKCDAETCEQEYIKLVEEVQHGMVPVVEQLFATNHH